MTPVVQTTAGRIQGRERNGALLFAGVPYVAPPVGELRFQPPEPHPGWSGVREATRFGPISPQQAGMMELLAGGGGGPSGDEDCLTLNVVTPSVTGERPVMVWIHGGGFTGGTGSIPWYDGTSFAARGDIVVVTINYRLGALGWLHLGGHDDSEPTSGNSGLLDQVAALQWVRDNISAFGGDPANVTIFGESAGGMSVGTLLGLPAAQGLFHRAIPQSGAATNVHTTDSASEVTDRLLQHLGLAHVAALRDVPTLELVAAQVSVAEALTRERMTGGKGLGLPFGPVVDGVTLANPPVDAVRAGLSADVEVLVGTTRDEWNLFALGLPTGYDIEAVERRLARFTANSQAILDAYRRNRPEATPEGLWNAMTTDRVFRLPAIQLAEVHGAARTDAGLPAATSMYRFDWTSAAFDGRLGACHALEIPFVFNTIDRPGVDVFFGGPAPQHVADAMHDAWISFARTGNAGHDGVPEWPTYDTDRRATMVFDDTTTVVDDPDGAERQAWTGH